MDPVPYKDIPNLIAMFEALPDARVSRALTWFDIQKIASEHAIDISGTRQRIQRIQLLRDGLVHGGTCNCVVPEGLRWHKVDRGEPVTWSVDFTGASKQVFDWEFAINTAFDMFWPKHTAIRFQRVAGNRGDIHISFGEIDGEHGTLGFAYMPASGDRMGVAEWAGDIRIDNAETFSVLYAIMVLAHEIGHAIGINHIDVLGNLMYPSVARLIQVLGELDIFEGFRRYPEKQGVLA